MQQPENQVKHGSVALVGAGPGDIGLLTLRGRELLEQADVVLCDALVNPRLRQFAPRADWIETGKRGGEASTLQETINQLMIDNARAGRQVVRLKGGDPFVFGRGGEECEALAAAGISFEVVPGITAALAAAAYAGIPATHRDFSSSFTVVTGHAGTEPDRTGFHADEARSTIDFAALAKLPCVAFYMAVANLAEICTRLIDHGMPRSTPAAIVERATTPRQRTVESTLEHLARDAAGAKIEAPAVAIIGRIVELRGAIRWFDNRPLFGQTIVVTRTRQQASELSAKLERLGANVIEAPTLEIFPPGDWREVDEVFSNPLPHRGRAREGVGLRAGVEIAQSIRSPMADSSVTAGPHPNPPPEGEGTRWFIFTSPNAVEYTRRRLFELNLDARIFAGSNIAALGESTARAVREKLCCQVDLCPDNFVAEALADALEQSNEVRGRRFVLLRADIARPVLVDRLRAAGAAEVRDVAIYETRLVQSLPAEFLEALGAGKIDWITFASSSSVTNLAALLSNDSANRLSGLKLASIGPITSQTIRKLGLTVAVEASPYSIDGLVDAIAQHAAKSAAAE